MNVLPLHDWAVIRPSEAESISSGGLYIPDTAKEKPAEGVVVAVGPGAYEEEKLGQKKIEGKERRFVATIIKPGDRVLYGKYAGRLYTIGHDELLLVRERDILGILPERPATVSRPLQLPATTSGPKQTALIKSDDSKQRGTGVKKATEKKTTSLSVKKTEKKIAKKKATKTAKKAAMKSTKLVAATKKSTKKATRKKLKK